MSGGSYEYLCLKDLGEILDSYNAMAEFERMNEALRGYGYDELAKDGEDIINTAKALNDKLKKLQDVWRAVEWYESHDWGIDSIHEAAKEYRESK